MDASRSFDNLPTPRRLTLTRVFESPRRRVFDAWTVPKRLAQWWGPNGFTNPVCELDAHSGGKILIEMRGPDGTAYPMTGVVREIAAPERLVFTSRPLDETGRALFEVVNTVEFSGRGHSTSVTLEAHVVMVTPAAERYLAGMEPGWSQSLDRLGALLRHERDDAGAPGRVAAISSTVDREIVLSRVVDAPRSLVWSAWTDPRQVVHWWGPRGFTTTIETMDVAPGGTWKQVMHGPDGTDYPNKSVFTEVNKLERIAYTHGGGRKGARGVSFEASWTFEAVSRQRTKVTLRMVFPTAESRDRVVKEYGAIEGGTQTLERLAEHLRAGT
jgi:uncharacterized protein YndB with AHSA1/START domain